MGAYFRFSPLGQTIAAQGLPFAITHFMLVFWGGLGALVDSDYRDQWRDLAKDFKALGGTIENLRLDEGAHGRGLFYVESSSEAMVKCPMNLLSPSAAVTAGSGKVEVNGDAMPNRDHRQFIEDYYQALFYEQSGQQELSSFHEELRLLPLHAKSLLMKLGIVDERTLNTKPTETEVFQFYKARRSVRHKNIPVLAPIWDLINHSSFASRFRTTEQGVETQESLMHGQEFLHRYNLLKGPLAQWRTYGFCSKEVACYSFPFTRKIPSSSIILHTVGKQGGAEAGDKQKNATRKEDVLTIQSLPIGSISSKLPREYFQSTLECHGISRQASAQLIHEVQTMNIVAREKLVNTLQSETSYAASSLKQTLFFELRLIRASLSA